MGSFAYRLVFIKLYKNNGSIRVEEVISLINIPFNGKKLYAFLYEKRNKSWEDPKIVTVVVFV